MSEQLHYDRAPITEAIIDFRVSLAELIELSRWEEVFAGEKALCHGRKRVR